ncbi:gamma-glutamyl-gamma-aminobutyrate hydrolase family protein [Streptomyces sp. NPDC017248]|uniref:gamma-glutamyl-gamma-aminobutyrate hydrolase family protein n=1 Tax=unclassified Streptomyces TaxID=2593676 RepID=UPI00378A4E5C
MTRPLVALACSTETWDAVPYATVRRAYVRALEEVAGCAVALIPGPAVDFAALAGRFDGLVLGGHESNVAPERYGGPPASGSRDPDRDALALAAVRPVLDAGLPLLGICRGLQELNVAFGGTLRDLPTTAHREDLSLPRDQQYLPAHEIRLAPDGRLRDILGGPPSVRVNSLHMQAIDRVAPGLRVEATADDGVVEAVSVAGARSFALAVQWHPEWYAASDPVSQALFRAFGTAAGKRAADR